MSPTRFLPFVLVVAACGGDSAGNAPSDADVAALCDRYCARETACMTAGAATCADACPIQFPRYREDLLVSLVECIEDTPCETLGTCERVFDDLVWTETANALVDECLAAETRCGRGGAGLNCTDDDIGFYNDPLLEQYRACMSRPCEEIELCVATAMP